MPVTDNSPFTIAWLTMIDTGNDSFLVVTGLLAAADSSLSFLLAVIVLLLLAAAVVMFRRRHSSRARVSARPSAPSETVSSSRPTRIPEEHAKADSAEREESGSATGENVVLPTLVDAQSVADALLASASRAGNPISCGIWRSDEVSDVAVRLIVSGSATPDLAQDETIIEAIGQDAPLLRTLVAEPVSGASAVWRYSIPVSVGDHRGAATIDFADARPDMQVLGHLASAFRLPVAAALILETARVESAVTRTVLAFAGELEHPTEADSILATALDSSLRLVEASSGSVMLYDEAGIALRIVVARGLPADVVEETTVKPGDGIAGLVALSGQPLVVEDLPDRPTSAHSRGVRSAASVPILDEEGLLGVLNVGSREYPSPFTSTHVEGLQEIARHTAAALRHARKVSSMGDLCLDTLKALALALETKDPFAIGGTDRVMHYASILGEALDLPQQKKRALEIAAMLHDIGMSALGETAMISDRPLSTVERGLLNMHPVIGADIIDQVPALREAVPIVYHHHEHYDGTGYVGGLARDEIPLGARILAVADAFVAMTSDRPHRPAMTQEAALDEIRRNAGTQFDPDVAEIFVALVEEAQADRVQMKGA